MAGQTNFLEVYQLFNQLHASLTGQTQNREAVKRITQYVTSNRLSIGTKLPYDESVLVTKISNNLTEKRSKNDAIQFLQCFEKLSTVLDQHNRNVVLTFLYSLTDTANTTDTGFSSTNDAKRFTASNLTSDRLKYGGGNIFLDNVPSNSTVPSIPTPLSFSDIHLNNNKQSTLPSSSLSDNQLKTLALRSTTNNLPHSSSSTNLFSSCNTNKIVDPKTVAAVAHTEEIIQDFIYAATGIQGKFLIKDIISGGFKLNPKIRSLTITESQMLLRLAELGYYHDHIQSFCDIKSGRSPLGLLGQGLITALKSELTEYYGMVAMWQEYLQQQHKLLEWHLSPSSSAATAISAENGENITLMKVMLWAAEPLNRLYWLNAIGDVCQEKKGGALATVVANFLNHGDPSVKALAKTLCLAVCGPLIHMLKKWLLEGEIDDPHSEFFIECLPEIGPELLWTDKYRVRDAMLPQFISRECANKILITGKSINFLRERCKDKTPIKDRDLLRKTFDEHVEDLFAVVSDTKLHTIIDTIYLNTSKRVLDIAKGPHKLLQNLQAMRNYLLLGQGDFVRVLMELMKPELDRPGKDLFSYEMTSLLHQAIRSTNAQYDDPEILNQLEVKLLGSYDGDYGWDIFTLNYTVRGPLATMLESSANACKNIFKPLWKMKHLEYVLSSKIWKDQICNAKLLRSMQKELNPITYRLHLYTSEMIHFIHQIQYYIMFEVIECLWTRMLDDIEHAKSLDEILHAHIQFLRDVQSAGLMNEHEEIAKTLRNVWSSMIKLESWQDKFYEICFVELSTRKRLQNDIKTSEQTGKYGVTAEQRFERDQEEKLFRQHLIDYEKSLEKVGRDYQYAVQQFLLGLAQANNHNLQLFGTRLDFNEYYKKRDYRLDAPLMFANMRHSSMFQNSQSSITNNNKAINNNINNNSNKLQNNSRLSRFYTNNNN